MRFRLAAALLGERAARPCAVSGISLQILPGETVGIVGGLGRQQSTLYARYWVWTPISPGTSVSRVPILPCRKSASLAKLRREAVMVAQDPVQRLEPRMTIGQTIGEVLAVRREVPKADIPARIGELLDLAGLEREFAKRSHAR